jgi:hypothetical protein
MPKTLFAFLLALLALPVCAKPPYDRVAFTSGELALDAEGRVVSVKLDHKDLGAELMSGFERQIREWRFEPVLEDGKAVSTRASVQLDMRVRKTSTDAPATLTIRNVYFGELPTGDGAGLSEAEARASGVHLPRPPYPWAPMKEGVGGQVWLLVRVGADGGVTEAAIHAAELRTVTLTPRRQKHHMRAFALAAQNAAKDWKLHGYENLIVMVPVKFALPGEDNRNWVRVQEVELEKPPVAMYDDVVLQLNEAGDSGSDRFRLLTAPDWYRRR